MFSCKHVPGASLCSLTILPRSRHTTPTLCKPIIEFAFDAVSHVHLCSSWRLSPQTIVVSAFFVLGCILYLAYWVEHSFSHIDESLGIRTASAAMFALPEHGSRSMGKEPMDLKLAAYRAGRVLRVLGRPVRVTEPCLGLGGLRRLCQLCESPYRPTQAFDVDDALSAYHKGLQQQQQDMEEGLHIGEFAGDVNTFPLASLEPTEIFCAGPPCQPWAGTGKGDGVLNERSDVFETCVSWVIELGWRGQLVAFTIENSARLMMDPYSQEVLRTLRLCLPMFVVEAMVHDLSEFCPQQRQRMWIRGLRMDCNGWRTSLPPPLTAAELRGRLSFEGMLDKKIDPINPTSLSATMGQDVQQGKAGEIAVVQLDRNPLREFSCAVMYDCIPALRTSGPRLFLLHCEDVQHEKLWHQHQLHRFLSLEERYRFQGHDPRGCMLFRTKTDAARAVGNAYHPLQLAAMLCPLLEAAYVRGCLKEKPETLTESELRSLCPSASELLGFAGNNENQDVKRESVCVKKETASTKEEPAELPKRKRPCQASGIVWQAGQLKQHAASQVLDLASPQRRVRQKGPS